MYSLNKKNTNLRKDFVTKTFCRKNPHMMEKDTSYESSSLWQPYQSLVGTTAELSSMQYSHSVLDVTMEKVSTRNTSQHSNHFVSSQMEQRFDVSPCNKIGVTASELPTISYSTTDCSMFNNDKELCYPLSSTIMCNSVHTTDSGSDLLHISSISSRATAEISSQYFSLSISKSNSMIQKGHTSKNLSHSSGSYTPCHLNSSQCDRDFCINKGKLDSTYSIPEDSINASMKVFCASFYQDPSIDSGSNDQTIYFKGNLGKRPECIGQECSPLPRKLKSHAINSNVCSSKLTPVDNLKTIHMSSFRCDTNSTSNRRSYKDISNNITSNGELSNITADSDNSVFMGKPLCCAGIVSSKVLTKDRKKSIKLRLKKMAKQLKSLHHSTGLKNTKIKTLAVL